MFLSKKINGTLWKEVASPQCSRKKCVEIIYIRLLIDHSQIETNVCNVLKNTGVNITAEKFECRRLNKKGNRTIVNFQKEKTCDL